MARTPQTLGMISVRAIFALILTFGLLGAPMTVFAQASAPASPGQAASASASPAQAPGAAQPSTAGGSAAASGQPAAGSASPAAAPASAAASPAPAGAATPVGSNPPKETVESLPLLAWLLIVLAAIWFVAAIAGIIRLLMRPTTGPYAVALPAPEQDRHFLSFIMPFGAIITVFVILVCFGTLFLWLAGISPKAFDTEIYPLAVDLFIVCFVMFVATMLVLRGSRQSHSEVH
jgi:hypothetical protein